MKPKNYLQELMVAKNAALRAWNLIAPIYDSGVNAEMKEDGTPVTEGDKLANKLIVEILRKEFPKDGIVSEEDKTGIAGKRCWYIDPIDGTKGFIKRNGQFAIHLGLCENESPVLGVVYWPVASEMYFGIPGVGAWRENLRGVLDLKITRKRNDGLVAIVNADSPPIDIGRVFSNLGIKKYHNSGSEGLRLMKLVEGLVDVRITEKIGGASTWDVCAPQAIVEAAGGTMKYITGKPIRYNGQRDMDARYVAANDPSLVDNIVEIFRKMEGRIIYSVLS